MDGSNYQAIVKDVAGPALADGLRLAVPAAMSERPRSSSLLQRLVHPMCIVAAATAHLGLAALMLTWKTDEFGEDGIALEAIAVDVIEAMPSIASVAVASSDGAAGEPVDEVSEKASPATEPPRDRTEAKVEEVETVAAADDAIAIAPPVPKPPQPDADTKPEPEPEPEPQARDVQSPPAAAQAASLASVAVGEANHGVVNAYGAALSRIISRGRPQGRETRNLKGTVVVEFVVGASGGLERADVKVSSGNPRLDDLGVSALRKLQLPAPAPEMTLKQRTFTVPFVYR